MTTCSTARYLGPGGARRWRFVTGAFALSPGLRSGALAQLPAAHIEELLKRFERLRIQRGEAVIHEGEEGDYYLPRRRAASRSSASGRATVVLAELKSGDAFGRGAWCPKPSATPASRALSTGAAASEGARHLTNSYASRCCRRLSFPDAAHKGARRRALARRALSLGIPVDKLPGAINVPLAEVPHMFAVLARRANMCLLPERPAQRGGRFSLRPAGFRVWCWRGALNGPPNGRPEASEGASLGKSGCMTLLCKPARSGTPGSAPNRQGGRNERST